MSNPYAQVPSAIEDNCDVITVWNYAATAIGAGAPLVIDETNLDSTKPTLAVATIASANSTKRVGIAKNAIPAAVTSPSGVVTPGVGQMVVGGICRSASASTAFTVGQQVATAATAGLVAVSTTAGAILGTVIKAETTTTPLIMMGLS